MGVHHPHCGDGLLTALGSVIFLAIDAIGDERDVAIAVFIVIIGGIKSIANVASKLVPAMGVIYLTAGLIVIAIHYANIPAAFVTIFSEAFNPSAGLGGLLGVLLVGVQRETGLQEPYGGISLQYFKATVFAILRLMNLPRLIHTSQIGLKRNMQ